MSETGGRTIGLIHGTGHGAWAWDLLIPKLGERGFDTIVAMDLPIEQRGLTYADHANVAALALSQIIESGRKIDLLLAHSGGTPAVPGVVKLLGRESILGIVYISGSMGADPRSKTANPTAPQDLSIPRQRSSEEFQRASLRLNDDRIAFDTGHVQELFYNDERCPPEVVLWAMRNIRPSFVPSDPPPLSAYKLGIPSWYTLGKQDRIRDRETAIEMTRETGMTLVEMEGDHSPAITSPDELADVLKAIADSLPPSKDEGTQPLPTINWGMSDVVYKPWMNH